MGKLLKSIPPPLAPVLAGAVRAAVALPTLIGPDRAAALARAGARAFATSRINRKKFPRALNNLRDAYPGWPDERIHDTAVAAYEHLFQLGVEFLYAPRLITEDGYSRHLAITRMVPAARALIEGGPILMITGHVGNWELIGYSISMLGFHLAAVYRPLDLKPLDAWLRRTRQRQGLSLVSKFGAVRTLPPLIAAGTPIALVADQNGGDRGVYVPFFGRLTSTYKMIGLMAMKYGATIVCGMGRRLGPGEPDPPDAPLHPARLGASSLRFSAEITDVFGPQDWNDQPDPLFYLTARYRRAIELMVRRAPEQYLWMHRIWRSRPAHERADKPFPPALREKLAALPWMTSDDVERVVERSERDRAAGRAT